MSSVVSEQEGQQSTSSAGGIKTLSQSYIVEQLRQNGHKSLAASLSKDQLTISEEMHKIVKRISNQLAQEKKEQMEDICFELQLTKETLTETFDGISQELFKDGIKWGRIVTFIAFSGAMAVYCAQNSLGDEVSSVMRQTGSFIQDNLHQWMLNNDGWCGFVRHFDEQDINLNFFVPAFFIGLGMTALAVAGSVLAFKRKYTGGLL